MATLRERHNPIRLFWRRLGITALLMLVAAGTSGVWNVYHKERESRALRTEAEAQLRDLSRQEVELRTQIAKLETDRGKEEVLREQYAIGKRGEGLIIIVDPQTPVPIQASSTIMQWVHKFLPFW